LSGNFSKLHEEKLKMPFLGLALSLIFYFFGLLITVLKSSSMFQIHLSYLLLVLYFKLIFIFPLHLYFNNFTGFQLKKKSVSNWQPSYTKPWPLSLQL